MTKSELLDRIETWLQIHGSNKRPLPSGQLGQAAEAWWAGGLLHNASELELVAELKGTPEEDRLREAVDLAKTGKATNLDAIEVRLLDVHKALRRVARA